MKKHFSGIVGRALFTVFVVIPAVCLLVVPIFVAGVGLGTYLYYKQQLPKVPEMQSYQPRTVSTFFADDGTVIGVFYKQKRFVVDLDQIPPDVVNAFLAAEDADFFHHGGVELKGLVRAFIENLKGNRVGGSTITMQVTRNFLLTQKKLVSRKIKEIMLALELDKAWGKKKILHIYLNEIYLGEGCYGVEAAARGYFGKPVQHLTVAEAALIAGLVASPVKYNPFKDERKARARQLTVLRRMLKAGFINEDQYNQAREQKLVFKEDTQRPFDLVPDYAEAVRRYIVRKYGADMLYNQGLKVFTACKVDFQRKAQESMEKGLKEVEGRQKNLAIVNNVPPDQIVELLEKRRTPELTEGKIYQGVVVKVIPDRKKKQTDLIVALSKKLKGVVHLDKLVSIYHVGHVLALRWDQTVDNTPVFVLDDKPKLQGALVCIENKTGFVRAVVGGATGERFQFNRAIQGKRQPGSAFKPIIYAVALEARSYSPATVVVDEPIVVDLDDKAEESWEPKNAGGNFLGPMSFRRALELSRNICTIKILMDVGFDPVIRMARSMGIEEPLGSNLSLSLGTSELSLYELTAAYTVFPNSGVYVEPIMIKRIEDRFGNVLEDNTALPMLDDSQIPYPTRRKDLDRYVLNPPDYGQGVKYSQYYPEDRQRIQNPAEHQSPKESSAASPGTTGDGDKGPEGSSSRVHAAMSPQTAYIMTCLLQGGVRHGTGAGMRKYLTRGDLAGKTGTTNRAADTWFVGFCPDFTAGVWVGFDEKRPLGSKEGGGRAALPIWGYFMKDMLQKVPERQFPVPPEVVFEELVTVGGNPKEGFVRQTVTEPVYAPFAHQTIFSCPLDPPQTLAEYVDLNYPAYSYEQPQYGAPGGNPYYPAPPPARPGAAYQQPPPPGAYAPQPNRAAPQYPPPDGTAYTPQPAVREGAVGPGPGGPSAPGWAPPRPSAPPQNRSTRPAPRTQGAPQTYGPAWPGTENPPRTGASVDPRLDPRIPLDPDRSRYAPQAR